MNWGLPEVASLFPQQSGHHQPTGSVSCGAYHMPCYQSLGEDAVNRQRSTERVSCVNKCRQDHFPAGRGVANQPIPLRWATRRPAPRTVSTKARADTAGQKDHVQKSGGASDSISKLFDLIGTADLLKHAHGWVRAILDTD